MAGFDFDAIINNIGDQTAPPLHLWQPELCGDIDIRIDRQGVWSHCGKAFMRPQIPELFARILCLEEGEYYLKTPVEKWRIQVDDVPFNMVHVDIQTCEQGALLQFVSRTKDVVLLDDEHPLRVAEDESSGEPSPYIMVRDGLEGKISRNLYYQLIDLAEVDADNARLYLRSAGMKHLLGCY